MSTKDAVTALMALASSSSNAVEPYSSSSCSMIMERTTCDKRSLNENMFDDEPERNKFSNLSSNNPYKTNHFVPFETTYADKLPAVVNESVSQGTIHSYTSADSCLGLFTSEVRAQTQTFTNVSTIHIFHQSNASITHPCDTVWFFHSFYKFSIDLKIAIQSHGAKMESRFM